MQVAFAKKNASRINDTLRACGDETITVLKNIPHTKPYSFSIHYKCMLCIYVNIMRSSFSFGETSAAAFPQYDLLAPLFMSNEYLELLTPEERKSAQYLCNHMFIFY